MKLWHFIVLIGYSVNIFADYYVYLSWFDTGLSNIVELVGSPTSLSYGSFLVRKNDGTIYAWGHNDSGKLGTGDTSNIYRPRL